MTLTLSTWEMLTLMGVLVGGLLSIAIALIRFFIAQDRRLDVRFTALLSELPMQYQRRDDAIRFETAVLARIDALGEKLHRALECDIRHCPVKDVFNCEVDHGERR